MVYARIVSISFMLFLLFFYLFSDEYIAFLLFIMMAILFLLSFLFYALVKRKVSIHVSSDSSMLTAQQETIYLIVKNNSILPIIRMKCHVEIHNLLVDESYIQEILVSCLGKSKSTIPIQIKSDYIGKLEISIPIITVYDVTGVCTFSRSIEAEMHQLVLPEQFPIELLVRDHSIESIEGQNMEESKSLDSQEIIGMKEYEPTDNIKHIHWKLSSKLDELVVKEIGEPLDSSYSIIMETALEIDHPSTIHAMIESAYSLSIALLEQGHPHQIGWYDQRHHYFVLHRISTQEALHYRLHEMLTIKFNDTSDSSLAAYSHISTFTSTVFYFTSTTKKAMAVNNSLDIITLLCVVENEDVTKNNNHKVISFTPPTMKEDLGEILY